MSPVDYFSSDSLPRITEPDSCVSVFIYLCTVLFLCTVCVGVGVLIYLCVISYLCTVCIAVLIYLCVMLSLCRVCVCVFIYLCVISSLCMVCVCVFLYLCFISVYGVLVCLYIMMHGLLFTRLISP